ncbi:TetR/AcrR family transcriptional regulator [Mycolicibacterium cosmeticum]|nr:TetR/AcrR family transcriptional regulator [Mycolicibacterium cosmeticum]
MPLERMITTAIAIVDEHGADALSMRSLASALGSGTATLYRHFASRAELVAAVVDAVLGEVSAEAPAWADTSWRHACEGAAHTLFTVFNRHPNVAPLLIDQIPSGPHAAAAREQIIGALLAGGFSPRDAAKTYTTLSRFVLGFAIQARGTHADDDPSAAAATIDPDTHPHTAAVAEHLPIPLAEEFAFGLSLLLDGLTGLAPATPPRRKR